MRLRMHFTTVCVCVSPLLVTFEWDRCCISNLSMKFSYLFVEQCFQKNVFSCIIVNNHLVVCVCSNEFVAVIMTLVIWKSFGC